jgi:peroxiredoxin
LPVLKAGAPAPDFAVADTTLHRVLEERSAVVFFFPKAFTPG